MTAAPEHTAGAEALAPYLPHLPPGSMQLVRIAAEVIEAADGVAAKRIAELEEEAERLRSCARHLIEMIHAQERDTTPAPKRESVDDANSRDEEDQIFANAIQRMERAIANEDEPYKAHEI